MTLAIVRHIGDKQICRISAGMPITNTGGTVNILAAILGTITSIVAYSLLMAGVYKLYTIGNDLAEIRKILTESPRERAVRGPDAVLRE